jgi:hypothetical protein
MTKIQAAKLEELKENFTRCATVSDVVRGGIWRGTTACGGHNIAGSAMCRDGLVIDLSKRKATRVDRLQVKH